MRQTVTLSAGRLWSAVLLAAVGGAPVGLYWHGGLARVDLDEAARIAGRNPYIGSIRVNKIRES